MQTRIAELWAQARPLPGRVAWQRTTKVNSRLERLQLALEAGARKVLVLSKNERVLANAADEVPNKLHPLSWAVPI